MRVADDVNLEKVDDSRVARQSSNRTSEYLAQRRKGAKVRKKDFELGVLATWREEYPDPRVFGRVTFAQAAQTLS
jgi:hypothetical protein